MTPTQRRLALLPALLALAAPAALHAQQPARAQVTVTAAQVVALDARLRSFAAGLPAADRAAWSTLLRRAAAAPAPGAGAVRVRPVLYTPPPVNAVRTGASNRIIVQGGIAPRPGSATGMVSMGPKQDDPSAIPASLLDRLRALSPSLTDDGQRAALDWLLDRAIVSPRDPASGQPSGRMPSLAQALGVASITIGPKQDDPAQPTPPPSEGRWVLTF